MSVTETSLLQSLWDIATLALLASIVFDCNELKLPSEKLVLHTET